MDEQRDRLIHSAPFDAADVERLISNRLEQRLDRNLKYTREEIEKITKLDRSLFPEDFQLNEEHSNDLRALASLSQCQLKPARSIRSHRPILGPLIVALKKITWKLIKVHLEEPFDGLQEFSARMVDSHAKQILETEQLKKQITART
jgi:hypothetical protein